MSKTRTKGRAGCDDDIPVLKWLEETYKAPNGTYMRVQVFIHEHTGKPIMIAETSTSRYGPWCQMGLVL